MKKVLYIAFLLVALPILAQQDQHRSTVNVTGEGTVKVEPDEVVIKSRIEHEGDSATEVKKKNDEVVDKVIKYLKSQNIDEKDINTDYVNLNKHYNYNEKTYSYVANQAISISLDDISKYEKIMKGLLETGLNRIDGIQFRSSQIEKYETEARKKAVLNAKSKAQQLAAPLGQEIGKAFSISEVDYNNVQPFYRMEEMAVMSAAKGGDQQTIAPGEMELSIKVNIGFELR